MNWGGFFLYQAGFLGALTHQKFILMHPILVRFMGAFHQKGKSGWTFNYNTSLLPTRLIVPTRKNGEPDLAKPQCQERRLQRGSCCLQEALSAVSSPHVSAS